jgi:hypothetical protein
MNAVSELTALYEQWQSLTESESQAIEAAAWVQVEQYQAAKSRLQPRITEVTQRLDATVLEREFRPVIEELIRLEHRNNALLQQQRSAAERQRQELDRTSRSLRQIHKSYVPPVRTHWQSYS